MPLSAQTLLASTPGFARASVEIASPSAPHAWLLVSSTTGGAAFFGRALARAALCAAEPAGRPCETCATCRRTQAGTEPAMVELWPRGMVVRIEQVQMLREAAALRLPGRKVFLIQRAERLGPESGNALLKTLEEPPAHTVFVLATHRPDALLATILSRVRRAVVDLPPTHDLSTRLGIGGPQAAALSLALRVVGPSPQAVLSLAAGPAGAVTGPVPTLEDVATDITKMLKGIDPAGYPTPVHALLESGLYALALTRALGAALTGLIASGDLAGAMALANRLEALHAKVLAAGERWAKTALEERREALGDAVPEDVEEELGQTKLTVGRAHVDLVLSATAVLVELSLERAALAAAVPAGAGTLPDGSASGAIGGADLAAFVPWAPGEGSAARIQALLALGSRLAVLRGHAAVSLSAADLLTELALAAAMGAPRPRRVPPDLLSLHTSGALG